MQKIAAGLALMGMCIAQTAAGQDVIFLKCTLEVTQDRFASALTRNQAKLRIEDQFFRNDPLGNSETSYYKIEINQKNLRQFKQDSGKYNCLEGMCNYPEKQDDIKKDSIVFEIYENEISFVKNSDHLVRLKPYKGIRDRLFSNYTEFKFNRKNGYFYKIETHEMEGGDYICPKNMSEKTCDERENDHIIDNDIPGWKIDQFKNEGQCEPSQDMEIRVNKF